MGKGLSRRAATVKIGALVAVVLLVLALPTLAFAANTASFSGRAPSGFSAGKPTVSVVVYDRYGVRGSANYSLYIDGVKKSARISYYAGFGYKKFRLSFAVPASLTNGSHTVLVRVKDTKAKISTYTWKFTADTIAPVTVTSPVSLPQFLKTPTSVLSDNVQFLVTENGSGLAKTFYQVDGGPVTEGTFAPYLFGAGSHSIRYWSVDKVGNVEVAKTLSTFLQWEHGLPVSAADAGCLVAGCHGGFANAQQVHAGLGPNYCTLSCHLGSITATNDCVTCHTSTPPNHTVATHVAIDSSATAGSATDCTNSGCHGSSFVTVHNGCAGCHNPQVVQDMPDPALVNTVIASGVAGSLASCESCHVSMTAAHAPGNVHHTLSGACFVSNCHGTDVTKMHGMDFRGTGVTPPGCAACHAVGKTPSTSCGACHPDLVTPHDYTAAHAMTVPQGITVTADLQANSTACIACHGTDLTKVDLVNPGSNNVPTSTTGFDEHKGCSCHAFGIAGPVEGVVNGHVACTNCHKGTHTPHGETFLVGTSASGHNTTMFGEVGAYTKWDGSEGVVVKDSANATITQDWPLPTADVFWSQSSKTGTDSPLVAMANRGFSSAAAGAAALNTTVGWGSVITCADCHNNVTASGPQGANMSGFGIDPNFPDDWTKAELTTWDPTGMRSTDTTVGTANPYYTKFWDGRIVGLTTTSTAAGSGYSWGTTPSRFICMKCHKLTNWKQGYPAQNRTGRSQQGMGVSNTAHMEHHPDQILGQANCVSCHVAIPHGWVRPRLLVYSSDSAPYKAPQPSNWFYTVANGYPADGSWYLDGIYGGVFTASLESSPVVPGYGRELVDGGTIAGWDNTVKGVEWIAPGTETGENEGQPNCNACTATNLVSRGGAAAATHSTASEGVMAYINLTTGETTNTAGLPGFTPTSLWK